MSTCRPGRSDTSRARHASPSLRYRRIYMKREIVMMVIVCLMIASDVIIGLLVSFYNGNYKSRKMREGMWHKLGELAAIVLCFEVKHGAALLGIPIIIPLVESICVYLYVMEAGSCWENIKKLAPTVSDFKGGENDQTKRNRR